MKNEFMYVVVMQYDKYTQVIKMFNSYTSASKLMSYLRLMDHSNIDHSDKLSRLSANVFKDVEFRIDRMRCHVE